MTRRRFIQCDVFTDQPTKGNGLAVVLDADGLTDAAMQDFATWTNLAETTFILTPTVAGADYRVRIFTPTREMPFAGHPTLGSCAAWLRCGGQAAEPGIIHQECGVGVVDVDLRGEIPAFVAPPTRIMPMEAALRQAILNRLEIAPERVLASAQLENGPLWQVLELAGADDVLAVEAMRVRWPEFKAIGLIGAHPASCGIDFEVRMLAPSSGMSEDPITGSLNAAIAHWFNGLGRLDGPLLMSQGSTIGRFGRVHVRPDPAEPGRILIGGNTLILIEGTVDL
ncbi:MAG: PhzF family phenazine biosynthesis protein [Minwuia sp.]|nr:PhzF family phenazine biosynthesis protein [Minwuia sp.]